MRLALPFYRQTTHHTCGPTSLRMVLSAHGISRSERALERASGTHPRRGTTRAMMLRVLRDAGLRCRGANGTWDDVRSLLEQGIPVIVNFIEPSEEVGHFGVVIGEEGGRVVLHDPWNGEGFSLPLREFIKRWLGYKTRDPRKGWMLSAGRRRSS